MSYLKNNYLHLSSCSGYHLQLANCNHGLNLLLDTTKKQNKKNKNEKKETSVDIVVITHKYICCMERADRQGQNVKLHKLGTWYN